MTDIIDRFLGKHVLIEAPEYKIVGKLLNYETSSGGNRNLHRPWVFILETQTGKVILRGNWISVGVLSRTD